MSHRFWGDLVRALEAFRHLSVVFHVVQKLPPPNTDAAQESPSSPGNVQSVYWPKEFVGDLDRTYHYFLGDATAYSARNSLKPFNFCCNAGEAKSVQLTGDFNQ